jgi:hypothetical protein
MDTALLKGMRNKLRDVFTEFSINLDHNLKDVLDSSITIHTENILNKEHAPPHISIDFMLNNRNTDSYKENYVNIKNIVVETAGIYRLNVQEGIFPGKFSRDRYVTDENGYMPIISSHSNSSFLVFPYEIAALAYHINDG